MKRFCRTRFDKTFSPFHFSAFPIYNCKMSQKSARTFRENSLKVESISFSQIPHQSKLFLDFQNNSSEIVKFYPNKQKDLNAFAEKVLSNYKTDRVELCNTLQEINRSFGVGEKTLENIELLREKDCLAIVTGQQAGLFSGALYTIYKALSAVKMCEDLRRQNIKAVPVFWIAEEDHDFDEVKKTYVLSELSAGGLNAITNTPKNYVENTPVGFVKLDETINETIESLNLPRTGFTAKVKEILKETYKSGETYSTAFAKFLAKIFADYGVIFLSPLNEKLKKLSAPIFAEAIDKSSEIADLLLKRNTELEEKNYAAQVLVEENSFPFFYQTDTRQAMRRDLQSGKVKVQKSKTEFTIDELKEIAENSPQNLSPNALMRPIVQDYLLPTLTYFGGGAEIAYFAQNAVIYEVLNRPVTPIRHRSSFTIIEPKNRRTLEKYGFKFADLFDGKEKFEAQISEKFLNREIAEVFAETEEVINTQLNNLDKLLSISEPTLAENSANRRKKILWHIGALRKKYHHAEILKNETVNRRLETLFTSVLPHNALQERTLGVLMFLNLYGENFIEWVYNAIDSDETGHQIMFL